MDLVKEYTNHLDETSFAIQTTVESVECEDSWFIEQPAIPISLEFPKIHITSFWAVLIMAVRLLFKRILKNIWVWQW